ncbi:MAG: helix-turn-helix transcriptional regulator [Thermoleophilaceae bacterium]
MSIITTPSTVGPEDLRRLRRAAGLTQRQLSRAAGCSLSWIANAEGGYVPVASPTLARVHEVLVRASNGSAAAVDSRDGANLAEDGGEDDQP